MKKIKKLEVNLINKSDAEYERDYDKARTSYIADYKEYEGGHSAGLFGWKDGKYVEKPDVGEAQWNKKYPDGFVGWVVEQYSMLNGLGQQELINKINEIIEKLNIDGQ